MEILDSRLICTGCGAEASALEPYPFACPARREGDDLDHVLTRHLDLSTQEPGSEVWRGAFLSSEPNPFLRYRWLFHAYAIARGGGLSDGDYCSLVKDLDRAVEEVDGRGFRATLFIRQETLSRELGLGALWVKDETGNVSGSHKGRHLFGVALWLAVVERLGLAPHPAPPLAIASCGNAALAAAVVARAAERPLTVYVPPDAHPAVVERLRALGAQLEVCPRSPGQVGDPCYLAFRRELERGALPFSCQGSENGLIFDGGATLAWEMVSELLARGETVDRVFVQVGGGALASSVWLGLREAHAVGLLPRLPRLHAVQTRGAFPLARAWDLASRQILERFSGAPMSESLLADPARRAAVLEHEVPAALRREVLAWAAAHRSSFMWPWEEEPRSRATGILDDETYDWRMVVEGMLETGGFPLVVSEETLGEAESLVREEAGIEADATGTAGLAGALELQRGGAIGAEERWAVLVTGARRDGA